ncbi:MAG: aspartate carbamoyltransferase catalytic subunit [bacterium]|nr:aspartate carbamoyltransferase catalytic subunit [bacterium]
MLSNFIKISHLSKDEISSLIADAQDFKRSLKSSDVSGKTACLMFFENSTRTKISFEIAAKNLGMRVINFDNATSSINKGESLKETVENLYFIGIDVVIIRTSDDDLIEELRRQVAYPIKFINAGSGKTSHPSQALLDYFTMKERLIDLNDKKITIVGDIEHSRVAKSNIALLKNFGANIVVCAPEFFKPQSELEGATFEADLKLAIADADVVMGLRIQRERILQAYSEQEYIDNYRLSSQLLNEYAPNAILMHPGPVNRDIEITSELLDSRKGKIILEQARNGVFTRMAILNQLLGEIEL